VDEGVLVDMKGITKYFGGVRALHNVDFVVHRSEIVGLVGDNGAGKSTLIKILAGVYRPDMGEIRFDGKRIQFTNPREARRLGIETVYQDLALIGCRDIASNIFLGREPVRKGIGGWLKLVDRKFMDQGSQRALERLGVGIDSTWKKVLTLSGGQQQAVAIGRAILTNPRIVVTDEPTRALAVGEVARVLDFIVNLKKSGISNVIVSHTLQEIFQIADRIIVLRRGEKVGDELTKNLTMDEIVRLIVGAEKDV